MNELKYFIALAIIATSVIFAPSIGRCDEYERGRDQANSGRFREAYSTWKSIAERGDPRAQTAIGLLYARGDGVKQDFTEAAKWFERSSAAGDSRGAGLLGKMYWYGDGVRRDEQKAEELLRKAAAAGDRDAGDLLTMVSGSSRGRSSRPAAPPPPPPPVDYNTTYSAPPDYNRGRDSFDVSAPPPLPDSSAPRAPSAPPPPPRAQITPPLDPPRSPSDSFDRSDTYYEPLGNGRSGEAHSNAPIMGAETAPPTGAVQFNGDPIKPENSAADGELPPPPSYKFGAEPSLPPLPNSGLPPPKR